MPLLFRVNRVLCDVRGGFVGILDPGIWRSCFALITRNHPGRGPIMCDSSGCCDKDNNDNTTLLG